MTQCVLSTSLNPAGLSLKTLRVCSIATMAKTFKQSSSPLPNAGMWDTGACLMQHISESPRHAVEFSWSLDWESTPPHEFMADAGSIGVLPRSVDTCGLQKPHGTLLRGISNGAIDRSGANILVTPNGRGAMVERQRASNDDGLLLGMDEANTAEAQAAGNAVCPPVSRWIAEKLIKTF